MKSTNCSDANKSWSRCAAEHEKILRAIWAIRAGIKRGLRDGEDQKEMLARSAVLGKLEHQIHKRIVACHGVIGDVEVI